MVVRLVQPGQSETKSLSLLHTFLSTLISQLSSPLFWIAGRPRKQAELLAPLNLCC